MRLLPSLRGFSGQVRQELAGELAAISSTLGGEGEKAGRSYGGRFSSALKSGLASVGSLLATGAKVGAVAVAGGVGALTAFGLKGAASIEQVTIGFKSLLGSEQAATAEIAELQKFAAATPFQFQGVADAAKRILAFGQSVGIARAQVIPTLTTIGDLVSVLGGGQEAIDSTVRALGQMASKGKVSQEELLQLAEALPGFNVQAAIAAELGVSVADAQKQITAGTVSATTGVNAIINAMGKFPGAAGAMAAQSQTLLGVFSTFKDTVTIALSNAFAPVIPQLKDTLTQITPIIGEALNILGPSIGEALASVLPTIAALVQGLTPILAPLIEGLGNGLAVIAPALAPLGAALGQVASAIAPILPLLGEIIAALAGGLSPVVSALAPLLTGLSDGLIQALTPLLPVITQVGQILGATLLPVAQELGDVLGQVGLEIGRNLADVLTRIAPQLPALADSMGQLAIATVQILVALTPLIPPLVQFLTYNGLLQPTLKVLTVSMTLLAATMQFAGGVIRVVVGLFQSWQRTTEDTGGKISAVGSAITAAWNAVAGFFVDLWNRVVGAFTAAVSFAAGVPGRVAAALSALPGVLTNLAKQAFDGFFFAVGFAIGSVIKFFVDLPGRIGSALSTLAGVVSSGVAAVIGFFQALPGRVVALVESMWSTVTARFTTGVSAVVGFANSLPGRIAAAFSAAWAAGVNAFHAGVNAVVSVATSLPGRVASALGGLAGSVRGAVSGAASWLYDAGVNVIMGLIHGIEGAVGRAVDAVKRAMKDVVDGAKHALGISSPSTVFAELGGFTVAGYVQGIGRRLGDAQDAMAALFTPPAANAAGALALTGGGSRAAALTGGNTYTINITAGMGANPREIGATVVAAIKTYEQDNGTSWRANGAG